MSGPFTAEHSTPPTEPSRRMDHLPMHTFRQAVRRYGGNRYVKSFPCHSQFLCMAFAQLTVFV